MMGFVVLTVRMATALMLHVVVLGDVMRLMTSASGQGPFPA